MKITVRWNKQFASLRSKTRFCSLMRKCLMNMCRYLIIKNRNTLNKKLQSLDLTYIDLLQNLNGFIVVTRFSDGFIIGFSHLHRVGNYRMISVAKGIDFGSEVTGTPLPIFVRSLNALALNLETIYQRFIGLI